MNFFLKGFRALKSTNKIQKTTSTSSNTTTGTSSSGAQVAFSEPPAHEPSIHTRAASTVGSGSNYRAYASTAHSSPTQSVQSLATLTTVQSTAPPSTILPNGFSTSYDPHLNTQIPNGPPQLYSQQFNSAPSHHYTNSGSISVPLPHPATYHAVTQGNMLSDDASMITLASSSRKRDRRRSFDTDASIRALPPNSVFGGSKESLPLSVLSGGDRATMGDRASLFAERHRGDRDSMVMAGASSPLATPSHPTFFGPGSFNDDGRHGEDDDPNNDGRSITDSRSIAKMSTKRASTGASLLSVPLQGPDTTEPDTAR